MQESTTLFFHPERASKLAAPCLPLRRARRVPIPSLLGAVFGGMTALVGTTHAQTVYTYSTSINSNAWLNNTHWTTGGTTATDFPGVTANGKATVNGTITDIVDVGAFAFTAGSGLGINFNTSSNTGSNSNTGAAGSYTVGAIDFLSTATASLAIGNSSTTAGATGIMTLTGQPINGVAGTVLADEGSLSLSLAPSVASGPAMTLAFGNATTNVIQVNGSGSITVSSVIQNSTLANAVNSVTINGAGVGATIFSAANTYSGGTTVTAGTLLVNGGVAGTSSGTGSGGVTVNGGTLGGGGVITGNVTIATGAALTPGAMAGGVKTLTMGTATTGTTTLNGTYKVNLTATASDQISVLGALTLGTNSALVIGSVTGTLSVGTKYYIALNDGIDPVVGTFASGSSVSDASGDTFTVNYADNGDGGTVSNDISLTVTSLAAVPEPTTLLGGTLLLGVAGWTRRRHRRDRMASAQPDQTLIS